jgi:hypothetical protein
MVNLKTCVSTNFAPAQLADICYTVSCFGWLLVFVSLLALSSIFIVSYGVFQIHRSPYHTYTRTRMQCYVRFAELSPWPPRTGSGPGERIVCPRRAERQKICNMFGPHPPSGPPGSSNMYRSPPTPGGTDRHAAKKTSALDDYHMSQEQRLDTPLDKHRQVQPPPAPPTPAVYYCILDMDWR